MAAVTKHRSQKNRTKTLEHMFKGKHNTMQKRVPPPGWTGRSPAVVNQGECDSRRESFHHSPSLSVALAQLERSSLHTELESLGFGMSLTSPF